MRVFGRDGKGAEKPGMLLGLIGACGRGSIDMTGEYCLQKGLETAQYRSNIAGAEGVHLSKQM
jgi:hypothetical protein